MINITPFSLAMLVANVCLKCLHLITPHTLAAKTNKKSHRVHLTLFIIINYLLILVPGEPQDFKVVKVTSNSIELEWKAPRRDEQSTSVTNIKGYEIHYFKVVQPAGIKTPLSSAVAAAVTSETQIFKRKTNDIKKLKYVLTNLESNSLYKIQIFAYNMKGDGQRSNPLLVNTLDEGPNKPENIRSEISNDLLQIKWQAPSVSPSSNVDDRNGASQSQSSASSSSSSWSVSPAKTKQQVGGYRLYFNNEKFDVDAFTTQITFQRPKWGMY